MSYTRANAIAYLSAQFYEQRKDFSDSGFSDDDTATGWKSILDRSFFTYGISRANLTSVSLCIAADDDFLKIEALLDYFALDDFLKRYAARVDEYTEHPSPDAKRSQAYKNTKDALAEAKAKVNGYG